MNKTEIMNKVSRTFGRAGLQLKKHSPEILVVTGIVGGVTSAVLACKATTKASQVLEEAKQTVDSIHKVAENPEYAEKYNEEDLKKDLTITYVQTGVKLAKVYGPAIVLGTLSITSILAGHNIMKKRNVALAAAYTVVDKSFKEYRGRVVERFGKELDRELRYNIKAQEVEEVIQNEDGTETIVKKQVEVFDPTALSEYSRIYDDGCIGWSKDADYNFLFLKKQQDYFNDLLQARGHVFLNEVFDALGFKRTKAGNVVGWIYDPKNPDIDNFIDFGLFNISNPATRRFVNRDERNVILDFNVDGPILNYI